MSCHGGVDQGGLVGNQWHSTNKTESNSLENKSQQLVVKNISGEPRGASLYWGSDEKIFLSSTYVIISNKTGRVGLRAE